MERQTYTCTYCHATFQSGEWTGCLGSAFRAHQVEPKTYHSLHDNYQLMATKETRAVDPKTGTSMLIPGKSCVFAGGHYTTTDPELQEQLEPLVAIGELVSLEVFTESKLTESQKTARAKTTVAEQSKLLEQQKAELERLKEENKKLAAAAAGPVIVTSRAKPRDLAKEATSE
jgi:hypothetical protein